MAGPSPRTAFGSMRLTRCSRSHRSSRSRNRLQNMTRPTPRDDVADATCGISCSAVAANNTSMLPNCRLLAWPARRRDNARTKGAPRQRFAPLHGRNAPYKVFRALFANRSSAVAAPPAHRTGRIVKTNPLAAECARTKALNVHRVLRLPKCTNPFEADGQRSHWGNKIATSSPYYTVLVP
jgi:hypothetical protein